MHSNGQSIRRINIARGTTVFHTPASTLRTLHNIVDEIAGHLPKRVKAFARWLLQPQFLIAAGILAVLFFAVVIFYYNKFATEIDTRLAQKSIENSVSLYTAPLKLSAGNTIVYDDLIEYLKSAGYQERAVSNGSGTAWFEVSGNTITVMPDANAQSAASAPVRIQIDKGGRINSLSNPANGQRLTSASINGVLLASVRDGNRRKNIPVQFSEIPTDIRNAIVAAEDRRFFSHSGIDWRGIFRALRADVDKGEFVQGGSTLTQQIIKNNFLSSERTLSRKIKEAAMAVILESRLTKEQIFTVYFNDVYLGQSGTFAIKGFGQAAQAYFDKDVNELTLAESAFLAALIRAPNRYSAHRDQARAIERRNLVLDAMVQIGAISPERASAAKVEPLRVVNHLTEDDNGTTYFIDYVQRFADARYGDTLNGQQHSVTTTLDPMLQQAAFAAVKSNTAKLDKLFSRKTRRGATREPVQAALVALDAHTGEVLAMVGGRSYDESQLNRATDAKRQPGSAFKPFVYATAINSRKFTAASVLSDRPKVFTFDGAKYEPSDFHGGFTNRDVTLREALAHSLNVPAVELAMSTGLGSVAAVAKASGLDEPRMYPSMALGTSEVTPLQLAGAYTAFANDGTALRPVPISNVEQANGSQTVPASSASVFSPQVAYLMTTMLQDVVDGGTASRLRSMGLKGAIAGKTGTTNDGWFAGYTPNIVCVAWVGFDDNRELGLTGSESALPLWVDFMKKALQIRPELGGSSFTNPGGLVAAEIDPTTGCVPGPYSISSRKEWFLAGTAPNHDCVQPEDLNAENTDQPEIDVEPVKDEPRDSDRVVVEVCALTGLIATKDCPVTEKREFDVDKAPRVACRPEFHRDPR